MNILKPDTKQVSAAAKNPIAYMLVVSLLFGGYMTYLYKSTNNQALSLQNDRTNDCKQMVNILLKRVATLEAKDAINTQVITDMKHNTDSLLRTGPGEKAKQIIKHN